jgi:hypothetical protein
MCFLPPLGKKLPEKGMFLGDRAFSIFALESSNVYQKKKSDLPP